jgi:hypothetical protein
MPIDLGGMRQVNASLSDAIFAPRGSSERKKPLGCKRFWVNSLRRLTGKVVGRSVKLLSATGNSIGKKPPPALLAF